MNSISTRHFFPKLFCTIYPPTKPSSPTELTPSLIFYPISFSLKILHMFPPPYASNSLPHPAVEISFSSRTKGEPWRWSSPPISSYSGFFLSPAILFWTTQKEPNKPCTTSLISLVRFSPFPFPPTHSQPRDWDGPSATSWSRSRWSTWIGPSTSCSLIYLTMFVHWTCSLARCSWRGVGRGRSSLFPAALFPPIPHTESRPSVHTHPYPHSSKRLHAQFPNHPVPYSYFCP